MQLQQSDIDAKELQGIEIITSVLTQLSADDARKLLRQYGGNIERAITAALDPEPTPIAAATSADNRATEKWSETRKQHNNSPAKSKEVIDLTGDDDEEMGRALKASLQTEPVFGPSNRPATENWSMVPTSNITSVEDQSLSQAIEASLSTYSVVEDDADASHRVEKRERPKPVVLRPASSTDTHIALLLQCLFSVYQVRRVVAMLDSSFCSDEDESKDYDEIFLQTLTETFLRLDLGEAGYVDPDDFISQLHLRREALHWTLRDKPGYRTADALKIIAQTLEKVCRGRLDLSRLFRFTVGQTGTEASAEEPEELDVVDVTSGGHPGAPNELFALLKAEMRNATYIRDLSEILVFHIVPDPSFGSSKDSTKREPEPFRYPTHLYLDQFHQRNREISEEIRRKQASLEEEMKKLTLRKGALTTLNGKEALTDIRTAIHYYENVAKSDGNVERQKTIDDTAAKLKRALSHIEEELKLLDEQLKAYKEQHASAYDVPELQTLGYGLKAVLVHNGLYGRKNIYSYVKADDCWWKTIDYETTEVPEKEVLNDATGLHFGAGPFMLFYSRVHSDSSASDTPLPWSNTNKNRIQRENTTFLGQLEQPSVIEMTESLLPSEARDVSMA